MLLILLAVLANAYGQGCKYYSYVSPNDPAKTVWSPNYPGNYGPSSTCYWYYYTDPDKRLSLDCFDVQLNRVIPRSCSDSLSVAGSLNAVGQEFCAPFNVESLRNKILLVFKSQPRSKGGRFTCTVKAISAEPCDCGWTPKTRVVGGVEAGINEFPLMVSIVDKKRESHACGGSIISQNFVLTAAHCLEVLDVKWTDLVVGEHDMSRQDETSATWSYRAAEFIIHPDYNRKKSWDDIGLIRSESPIRFNSRVGPVCLPFNRPYLPSIGDYVTAIGWGTTSFGGPTSDVLLKTRIQVVEPRMCIAVFNQSAASGKQVCTYTPGKDTCQMDSGGPLITSDHRAARYFLSALVSFGPSDCGGSDPSVNTRITPYLDWIQKRTGDKFCIK